MNWADAACDGWDNPDDWFPNGPPSRAIVNACAGCPIRNDCLAYALDNNLYGYWGGTTEDDRFYMRNGRPARRPRSLKPCGTFAAVQRHRRYGEPLDEACQQAELDFHAERYAKRKAKKQEIA